MKVCTRCKVEKPIDEFSNNKNASDGKNSWCKACYRVYRKENKERLNKMDRLYYERNREERIAYQKEYRMSNPEKTKETKRNEYMKNRDRYLKRRRKYYQENRDIILKQMKQYQKANRDRISRYKREYTERNRDLITEKNKIYYEENSGDFKERSAKRKALIRKADVGDVDYNKILARDKMHCYLCNEKIIDDNYHFDHVIPLSKGGSHSMRNIKVTHAECNMIKHDKPASEAKKIIREINTMKSNGAIAGVARSPEQAIELVEGGSNEN